MKVVVIGSKGFIGQHLSAYLKENGHEVWGVDVVVDYAETDRYFLIDASNSDFINVFQNQSYDLCINCSGAASVPDSLKNPMRDYYLNTVNVFNILSAINIHQHDCNFINLGSAAIYGNPEQLPISEEASPNPMSPYGVHKFQAEQTCEEFHRFWDLKTCSLRIFSVYGAGLKKQLFWDLNKKLATNKKLELFGTGNESRDFIHVSDLVRSILIIAENAEFKADIINVANGQEVFIKDAVKSFYSNYTSSIEFSFSGSGRQGDPVNWKADISKLKAMGYFPKIKIQEGLSDYFNWLRDSNYLSKQ